MNFELTLYNYVWIHKSKFVYCGLSSRSLPAHKLSGFISPDLGKLDQLKILYVSLRHLVPLLETDPCFLYYNIFLELMLSMMCLIVDLFTITISMGQFLQSWETAPFCRECKHQNLVCRTNMHLCLLLFFFIFVSSSWDVMFYSSISF